MHRTIGAANAKRLELDAAIMAFAARGGRVTRIPSNTVTVTRKVIIRRWKLPIEVVKDKVVRFVTPNERKRVGCTLGDASPGRGILSCGSPIRGVGLISRR